VDSSYNEVKRKIAYRRSDSDLFYKRLFTFEEAYAVYTSEGPVFVNNKKTNDKLTDEDKSLLFDYPLISYINNVTTKHRITGKHLIRKYENVKSLDIKTITRSPISTHEMHTEMFKNPRTKEIYPYKSVR
jgi:hypothetical protein